MPKSSKSSSESPYREIRAVSRALDLLEAVSELGWANVGQLANYTGIDRGTTYRLIHTLELKGYLERRAEDGTMSLANRILELGDGVRHEDIAVQVMSQTSTISSTGLPLEAPSSRAAIPSSRKSRSNMQASSPMPSCCPTSPT